MLRTLHIALREFIATVATKGFLFGVLLLPVMILGGSFLAKMIMSGAAPALSGTVLLIDHTDGQVVAPLVEARLSPEAQTAANRAQMERVKQMAKDKAKEFNLPPEATEALDSPMADMAMEQAMGGPKLTVVRLKLDADLDAEKAKLRPDSRSAESADKPVALMIIPASSIVPSTNGDFSTFELFTAPKLDFQIQSQLNAAAGQSVVDARLATSDLKNQADRIRKLLRQPVAEVKAVNVTGETSSIGDLAMLMPMAFMMLLWISTFTAGQYLLTTTIEEKSSRVMEVLLSAVSPVQLMTGKIIGQMGVGLTLLAVYAGIGAGSLAVFKLMHLIDWTNIALLVVFFIIAFFLIASLMAAIGSAVTDLREAQSLMTPVMLVLMIPLMLWMPISRNPNGAFATACSFIPPISPFVMVIRIPAAAGSTPVPIWQIGLSIAVGIVSVFIAVWAAAKIFRVGVLMYGKPPNFATLIKWLRMA